MDAHLGRPGSTPAAFVELRTAAAVTPAPSIGIDNLAFPEAGKESSKEEETKKGGEEPKKGGPESHEQGSSTTATTSTSTASTPPTPVLSALTLTPRPGQPITLSGAGSQPGSGHIISYEWDFNGDGKIDTSTGTNPIAHAILSPGSHTIGLTVVNSNGESASTRYKVQLPSGASVVIPDGGEGECMSSLEVANTHLLGECIQKSPGGGWVIETKQLSLNGMVFVPRAGGNAVYHVQSKRIFGIGVRYTMSGPTVSLELQNTPIGDMTLGNYDLEAEPLVLGTEVEQRFTLAGQRRAHIADEERVANIKGQPLMAFGVGEQCKAGEKKPTCCPPATVGRACATLPGSFPLKGTVVVYLSGKGQVTIDVQVGLNLEAVNFQATGELEILASTETGIELNSLRFTIPEASLKPIFKVKEASFVYYFPGNPNPEKRDTWQAKATVTFGVMQAPGLEGELSFQHGNFHSAALVLTLPPPGIPVFTGVYLNKMGASVGVEPLQFGGLLGAKVASVLKLELGFRYSEGNEQQLGYFGGKGTLKFEENEIATLEGDVYSDGYSDALLLLKIGVPFGSNNPVVSAEGEIGYWDEPSSGLWEAYGRVHLKLWIIEGEVAGLVNNKYIAGCAYIGPIGALGYWSFETSSLEGEGFIGSSCSNNLQKYKQVPLTKHTGGYVNETETESLRAWPASLRFAGREPGATIALARDPLGNDLRITSDTGTPIVKLTGPSGETFTTPATPGKVAASGASFAAALGSNPHQVIVYVSSPSGGEWHIKRAPGSAPISKVEAAEIAPPTAVRARVRRRGSRWSLAYSAGHMVEGEKIRFYERGKDSIRQLGTVSASHGAIAFAPAQGLARARTIYATVIAATGAPQRTLTVASYTAPPATRPGRVAHVRLVRRGRTAVLSWSAAAGAREYRVTVKGSDGRLDTFFPGRTHRSENLANVLPFESFTATVAAVGGPDMLPGRPTGARLAAVPAKRHAAKRRPRHH